MSHTRIPVTLLTGFLGAGKTTVLNAILSECTEERVAVVVNEFGDAGLDHDLIEESTEEIILMQSGCLCCSVRGDLSNTIATLFEKKDKDEIAFDRIVIETTGLADPGPIVQTLVMDPFLSRNTHLDGTVTVTDAAHGSATLDAQFEAVSQAATADLIILSKTDLASPLAVRQLEARLDGLNPGVSILHSVKGAGLSDQLWGLNALRPDASEQDVLSWTTSPEVAFDPSFGATQSTGSALKTDPFENLAGLSPISQPAPLSRAIHDTRIGTASIVLDGPLSDDVFNLWLETLIGLRGSDVLRIKGIVFLEGIEDPFVLHAVQHVFEQPMQLKNWPHGDRRTRIVVIARDLSRPELQRSLDILRGEVDPSFLPSNRQSRDLPQ